jgi:hypothetical protein
MERRLLTQKVERAFLEKKLSINYHRDLLPERELVICVRPCSSFIQRQFRRGSLPHPEAYEAYDL